MPDGIKMGSPVLINPVPENIAVLCEVVKTKMDPLLKDYAPSQLTVFPAGTTNFDDKTKGYKRSCKDFPKVDDEECPLIVVAPSKESGTSCMVVLIPPISHTLFHHVRKLFSLSSKIFSTQFGS